MRIIKFRGKDIETGEWVYGDLHVLCDRPHIHTEQTAYPYAGKRSFVDLETIGQLTGFHDRNGKEIYEGDIIDVHIPCNSIGKEEHRTRVVVWNEKCGRFEFQNKRGDCIADSVGAKYNVVYYEVVGNVFDNPELLEEGD